MDSICDKCYFRTDCAMYEPSAKVASCYCYKHDPRITNADRVRAMSDEELATFMAERNACLRPNLRTKDECWQYDDCEACWLDWLKQEAET